MSEKIKNYLGTVIIIALLAFVVLSALYVNAYSKSIEPSSYRSFSVSAEGQTVAIADVAQFTFSTVTQGGLDLDFIQKENTEKINQAIDYLKSGDVEAKDIKTETYSVNPRYQYYRCEDGPCPPPEIVGYEIRQSVSVKVRDFEKIGTFLSGVVEKGANSVSSLSFTIDDSTSAENLAREDAVNKAREKAQAVADSAGFRLGRLLSFHEGYNSVPYMTKSMDYAEAYGAGGITVPAPAPSIEPGSQKVEISVTLTYEIK